MQRAITWTAVAELRYEAAARDEAENLEDMMSAEEAATLSEVDNIEGTKKEAKVE